ncbi:MAG: hypothetical protein HFI39_03970 [Lachnospiraceae bacterium]|nr:hypothetical protein [Lachnospiraceae bacterium]
MTGQLIRVTTTPFQAVRFSQNARLVSSDSVDLERRKAIARMRAFQSKHSSGTRNLDMSYVNKINRTFSSNPSGQATAPAPRNSYSSLGKHQPLANAASSGNAATSSKAVSTSASYTANTSVSSASFSGDEASAIMPVASQGSVSTQDAQAPLSLETNSAYTMDRGAFEFRVATGDLSFLPPLVMTVITQRPEIHFEYMGGFNYVAAGILDINNFNSSI